MKKEVLANFDISWLPVIGMILFIVVFASIVYRVFFLEEKETHHKNSTLILDSDHRPEVKNG